MQMSGMQNKAIAPILQMLRHCGKVRCMLGGMLLIGLSLSAWYLLIIHNYHHLRRVALKSGLLVPPFFVDNQDLGNFSVGGYLSYPGNRTLKMRCATCAYVTGSGHMKGCGKGAEIDSMTCVFRSNNAPTTGYENDVGTRTTLRTVDRNSLRYVTEQILKDKGAFDPYVTKSTIILAYSDPYKLLYEQLNKSHTSLPSLKLHMITPDRYHEILKVFAERVSGNGVWASNGFITIYFAKDVCDEIHVYGINPEQFCEQVRDKNSTVTDVPYHYYGGDLMNCDFIKYLDGGKTQTHHFTREKAFYRTLIKEWGNIYFHAPEWQENAKAKNTPSVGH